MSKFHELWINLPICGVVEIRRPLVELHRQVEDEARPAVLLRDHHNVGHIEIPPKQQDHISCWEEDYEGIMHSLSHP